MRALFVLLTPRDRFCCLALLTVATVIGAEMVTRELPYGAAYGWSLAAAMAAATIGFGLQMLSRHNTEIARLTVALEDSQLQTATALADGHSAGGTNDSPTGLIALLALLRQEPTMPPGLRKLIEDYAWLKQMADRQNAPPLPDPAVFTLHDRLDVALSTARSLRPPGPQLHLSLSLSKDLPPRWQGQPRLIERLCRHLLLLGLTLTAVGLVRLRLEADPANERLRFYLTCEHPSADRPGQGKDDDLSWQLVATLIDRLGGFFRPDEAAQGLQLGGWFPCQPAAESAARQTGLPFQQPLILLIASTGQPALAAMLQAGGCSVFTVTNPAEGLLWAPLLPCSAILIDLTITAMQSILIRKLRQVFEHETGTAPLLWALTNSLDLQAQQQWLNNGIDTLLPLQATDLQELCRDLPAPSPLFYRQQDAGVRAELPLKASQRLPELNAVLADSLAGLQTQFDQLSTGQANTAAPTAFHSVRSIALSLGYFRLAALMNACETAALKQAGSFIPANWQVLSQYTCPGDCGFPLSHVPHSLTDEGMPSVPGFRF